MSAQPYRAIHVGGLPEHTTKEALRSTFSRFGPIAEDGITLERSTVNQKLFATITFERPESVHEAMKKINGKVFLGSHINISVEGPDVKAIIDSGLGNLYITNLDEGIDVNRLYIVFSQYGEVLSCHIPMRNGKSGGYGFVQFRNPADAERARINQDGAPLNGKEIHVQVAVQKKK